MTLARQDLDGYDLIGDVHGCGASLAVLLEKLGYRHRDGVYRHPRRRVIFLGDLIDRGPRIRLALNIVRGMVEAGEAHIVMGNHEYNALAYCHRAPSEWAGDWLREHSPRHNRIINETLAQFRDHPQEWQSHLDWFMTMPLCLERDGLRVVHACWDRELIAAFLAQCPDGRMSEEFLYDSACPGTFAFRVVDRLTRGPSLPLPAGLRIYSGDGFTRTTFRAHFWARNPLTYGDVVFQPDNLPDDLENQPLSAEERQRLPYYGPQEPPLFIGHYWCEGVPALPAPNIACLDYSAVKYGRLVAYRWEGERQLDANRFVWVDVSRDQSTSLRPDDIALM
ncbi:calcineurin-like phosphoesterase family protein [Chromohalobacter marismortui]|uniref:Calcineurin-like phosphoesterase family protein n=1 Tax=Chromohalobacter marismortui TaxID=42055 RepID=A0A4R7NVP6_9GAMM|nr:MULTISPECIES: metallophosphoesterase [Chromohalobacter]MCI0510604.1 metallophosphoesterase [Chromohalobacter sp.]MCI0591919.1 metallophosphoesterase [Chromohalobacter sp.]TDU24819.1 calcineurin-like phosphoesterase family protein [Chromohalobacter marismortui]